MLLKHVDIENEDQMMNLGKQFCEGLNQNGPMVIYLEGPLGAGKTTFVRGSLRGLGYQGLVKSPTYTLVESYEFPTNMIYHFDFYRLNDASELEWMGIRDYFETNAIILIEWPLKAKGFIPLPDITLEFEINGSARVITIKTDNDRGKDVVQTLFL